MARTLVLVGVVCACADAPAQSLNVNFGPASGAPSSGYAAAGAAGTWNSISGVAGPVFALVDLDGTSTTVTMHQSPTTTMLTGTDPSVSGDDAKLLDTGLDTTGAETCLFFDGVAPGAYEVLVYAWTPNAPSVLSRTRQEQAPSTIDVGGAWSGAHAEGVTYARYVVNVDSSGALLAHSGLAPGQPSAALNGVQIRPLSSSATDAGVANDGGTGSDSMNGDTGDAGLDSSQHGGGCAIGGGSSGGPGVLIAAFALLRRRKASAGAVATTRA